MAATWKRFLLVEFPLAVLALAAITQTLAWSLSDVPMRRNRTDELALAVLQDLTNYRAVVLADSITRNATARFSLGKPGDVANLATHAYFGMAGELFLLQRYLRVHTPPKYVVIVFAPGMYHGASTSRLVRYYLWYTFRQPEERDFLSTYRPEIGQRDWLPAVVDAQERIVEPLFSLMKQRYLAFRKEPPDRIAAGGIDPDPDAKTDASMPADPAAVATAISEASQTIPATMNAAALRRICALSEKYGFRIKLAWPPMADEIASALRASRALSSLRLQIGLALGPDCPVDEIFDFGKVRPYTTSSFYPDLIHLFGDGWEQRYASDLRRYLNELPDYAPAREAGATSSVAHTTP
jgi:hypothetical protein